jgi:carboxylesterase
MNEIMSGAEPFYYEGGSTGCLLTHGFTASPQEVHEMGTHLAGEGFTVLGVRLAGHGTSLENLARTRWQDWLHSVEDGYALLEDNCDSIFLAGLSTGAVLSMLLSTQYKTDGLIAMSTPIELPPIPALKILYPFLALLGHIIHTIPKGPPNWYEIEANEKRVAYNAYPLRAAYQFGRLTKQFQRALPGVEAPLLLMHSINDGFVPLEHMQRISNGVRSHHKETYTVERSNHIITCDAERERVFQRAVDFIHSVDENKGHNTQRSQAR